MKAFDIFQNVLIQNTTKILSKKKTSCSQILDWQDLCVHPLCDCERIQSTVAASNPFYALSLVFILSPIQFHLFLFYWHKRTWASTATILIPSPADVCVMEVDFLWSVRWSETDRPHLIDLLHLHCQSLTYQTPLPPVFIIRCQLKKYCFSLTKIYCVWHHTNSVSHSYCFFHSLLAIACFCLLFSSRLLPAPASTCSPDLLITCSRFPSFVFQDLLPPASNLPLSAIHWISNDNPQERALWKEIAFLCLFIIMSKTHIIHLPTEAEVFFLLQKSASFCSAAGSRQVWFWTICWNLCRHTTMDPDQLCHHLRLGGENCKNGKQPRLN